MTNEQETKTEGPWYVEERFNIFVVRHRDTGEILGHSGAKETAELMCKVENEIERVREAAPELLAACKAFIATVRRAENCPCRMCAAYDQATNAIAKAEQA